MVTCWQCPMCPMIYKRHAYLKQHLSIAHEQGSEEVAHLASEELTQGEYLARQEAARGVGEVQGAPASYAVDKATRKVVGKEWAPNSFSSRFTCMFCSEQFRKDYKLKLHLMMDHKDEPKEMMEKAKEELVKAKLDGCVHMCQICRNK